MTNRTPGRSELVARLQELLKLSEAEIARLGNGPFEAIETARAALGGRNIPGVQELLAALLPQLSPRYRVQLKSAALSATASSAEEKGSPPPKLEGQDDINLLEEVLYERWFIPDQRPRQTCVAYAAAACIELLWARHCADFEPLSAQFLYWYMRTRAPEKDRPPGWAEGATRLSYAKAVLEEFGICRETICPSGLEPDLPLEGRQPSDKAQEEATKYKLRSDHQDFRCAKRPAGIAYGIYKLLAEGRPVAIALPEFPRSPGSTITNWNNPTSWGSGIVAEAPPGLALHNADNAAGPGHAVCIVGFQQDRDRGGGWFLFRNSLGGDWANSIDLTRPRPPQVPAPGYGAISADHVERYCWEMLCPKLP
jgi:hypothetical protein